MSKTGYPFEADQRTVFPTAPTLTSYNDPPPSYSPTPPRQQQPQVIQPPQVAQQPQVIQQPQVAQQPYIYPGSQMMVVPPRPPPLPKEFQPNDYLMVSVVVAIVCGLFNLSSLVFSIPALVFSVMAFERRNKGSYNTAKNLGVAAIVLDLICVTWVVVGGVIAVGTLAACAYGSLCYYYLY